MPRSPKPPADFQCPYRHGCPHLEGLSTQWVWECYQEHPWQQHQLQLQNDDLLRELQQARQQLRQLQKDNAQLTAQLHALHRQQFQPNKVSPPVGDRDPAATAEATTAPRQRGAPVGHPGWHRPVPRHPDRTVAVPAPARCPHCGSRRLEPLEPLHCHLQEDIALVPRPVVTCYRHRQARCEDCQQIVLQAAPDELIGAPIGPVAKATASWLRYGLGLSYRKVQRLFEALFGLRFVPASAVGFDRAAARLGRPLYEDLREKIRASPVVHADETGWRVDGVNHQLWYAGQPQLAYFHVDRHRSGEVAQRLLGEQFAGVLVTDEHGAYNAVRARARQSCLAHPLREARDITEQLSLLRQAGQNDPQAETFVGEVIQLLAEACALGPTRRRRGLSRARARRHQQSLRARLDALCRRPLGFAPAESLRARLMRTRERLWVFLDYREVEPTNNEAERSLRPSVIMRKITFGNRSDEGAQTHSILMSLMETAKRQGRDPRKFLCKLLTCGPRAAQAALYRDTS